MMPRRVVAILCAAVGAGALVLVAAPTAAAHPLGNFTRNTYVGLTVSADRVVVDHVLDLAEVPTYQERTAMDTNGDGAVSRAEASTWGKVRCDVDAAEIHATSGARALSWTVDSPQVTFPTGQGGLGTIRLECRLSAPTSGATGLDIRVGVEEGRVGWHEITARGDGVRLVSDVPDASASRRLTAYPTDIPPLDVTSAHLSWGGGASTDTGASGPPAALADASASTATGGGRGAAVGTVTAPAIAPFGLDAAAQTFTDLVGRQEVTWGFALLAIVISVGLGGLHALAPGHGKTLMAASLVGTRGRRRDAVILGATVTSAHTAGVVVLAVALTVSSSIAAESAYPWLGLLSAALAVGVGVSLLRQARRGEGLAHTHGPGAGHRHDHGPGTHGHDHPHPHPHPHPHDHHDHGQDHPHVTGATTLTRSAAPIVVEPAPVPARPTTRRVVALGLAGGLVPSPSAVVVLLAGFALGRSWFALLLVIAYGLGMALTLCVVGVLLVHAGGLSRRLAAAATLPGPVSRVLTLLPTIAAVTVLVAGLLIGVRSVLAI